MKKRLILFIGVNMKRCSRGAGKQMRKRSVRRWSPFCNQLACEPLAKGSYIIDFISVIS